MGFGGPHAGYLAVHAKHARQLPGRLVGVSVDARRITGLPAVAADPRAAHPPRQGDQQHLHRAGAAGGDGRDVRQLPRRRGPDRDRPAGARPRRAIAAALGDALVHDTYFDTVLARVPGRADEVHRRGQGQRHQPVAGRRRPRVGGLRRGHHRRARRARCWRPSASVRRRVAAAPGVDIATRTSEFLTHPGVHQPPHRNRDDALPARRWPTRILRWTAA